MNRKNRRKMEALERKVAALPKPAPKPKRKPKRKSGRAVATIVQFPDTKPRKPRLRISPLAKARAAQPRRPIQSNLTPEQMRALFAPPWFPKSSMPPDAKMAMDTALSGWNDSFLGSNPAMAAFQEGQTFMGFQVLALMSQRPEYRKIVGRFATEMTRKWITLQVAGDKATDTTEEPDDDADGEVGEDAIIASDKAPAFVQEADSDAAPDDAPDDAEDPVQAEAEKKESEALDKKIKEITDEMNRLKVKERFGEATVIDGFMGRAHIYIDTDDTDDLDELKTSIGDGRDDTSRAKVSPKNPIKALRIVEPMNAYPLAYNTNDPLADGWYDPQEWQVWSKAVHKTRLLKFVGRPVVDILKPAYAFGGLPLIQMAKPYVDNFLRTRQSISDLVHSFSTSGIKTDLQSTVQDDGQEMFDRADMFNALRDNRGLMILNNDEEFFQYNTSLTTLDDLQAQAMESVATIANMPLVIYAGSQPKGLNASSEGEIRVWHECVASEQQNLWSENLTAVINFIQLSLYGDIDSRIVFRFEPLWSMNAKEVAETNKIKSETDNNLIDGGVISQEEARARVAADPDSGYNSLNVEEVPDRPDVTLGAMGQQPFEDDEGGNGGSDPPPRKGPGADDAWSEADHPRVKGGSEAGEFTTKGGGTAPDKPKPEVVDRGSNDFRLAVPEPTK